MSEVFIVIKKRGSLSKVNNIWSFPLCTNEAVFFSEEEARDYISNRISAHDRDDAGCEFTIEPWYVPLK